MGREGAVGRRLNLLHLQTVVTKGPTGEKKGTVYKDRNLYKNISAQLTVEIYDLGHFKHINYMCLCMYIYKERYTNVCMHI